jgi:hypothetical protein
MEHPKEQHAGGSVTLSRRRTFGAVGRAAGAAAAGLAAAVWPSLGRDGGAPALPFLGAGVAEANDEWCDTDPFRFITTPRGASVIVYYMTGVKGLLGTVDSLLSHLLVEYTAVPDNGGTKVTFSVTVPDTLGPRDTRLKCSSGLLGSGTVYGQTYGTAGTAMTVQFHLDVP